MNRKLFLTAKYLIFATAIAQLALSQIHIDVITKVFEPSVGFFLFLFIIFSVLMAFNASSFKTGEKTVILVGGAIAAVLFGIIYLNIVYADIETGKLLTQAEAQKSIIITIVTVSIYALLTPLMIITGYRNEE